MIGVERSVSSVKSAICSGRGFGAAMYTMLEYLGLANYISMTTEKNMCVERHSVCIANLCDVQ